ncbi:MAG: hypothetical protein E6Q98_15795 [Rhodospirillaceae bacterium]|nr:MAG: hypothetical protein E6Q98_15795 [Rhodospirillaceae bacterium]
MADVTGPISTLPGSYHSLPEGTKCDAHPDRDAVARVQGETDSFGCEMDDLCEECLAEHRQAIRSPEARTGTCDWCKQEATDIADTRDPDEGSCGPVYRICGKCRKNQSDRLRQEMEEDDHLHGYDDFDFDDPSDWD